MILIFCDGIYKIGNNVQLLDFSVAVTDAGTLLYGFYMSNEPEVYTLDTLVYPSKSIFDQNRLA